MLLTGRSSLTPTRFPSGYRDAYCRQLPRPTRRRSRHRVGCGVDSDALGDAGTFDVALPAGLAPTGRGEPGRCVPARRPGRLRARASSGHRRRRDADGFGDRPAASTRGVLRRDHEPGLPRAPGQHRRPARRRPEGIRRRRDRRDLAPRPARHRRWTATRCTKPNACCRVSSPTCARSRRTRRR